MEPSTQVSQEVPVSNDEKIGSFARGFLEEVEKHDNPEALDPDENPEGEAPPAEGEPEEQPPTEEAETPPPEPEEPVIEYELEDGKKLKVPEALKPHLMRDKDYRQKTMELAENRKALEQLTTQAQQVAAQAQQMAPYHAQLFSMDNRMQQLSSALTTELMQNDPVEYNRTQGELAILMRNRDQFAQGLHSWQSQLSAQQAELLQKKLALDAPKLFAEIPDLAKPEVREELGKYAHEVGLTPEEIAHANWSVSATRVLWESKQYRKMLQDNAKSAEKLKQQVKTLPPASKTSRAVDHSAQVKSLRSEWKRTGGKVTSPEFDALLRARLRGK